MSKRTRFILSILSFFIIVAVTIFVINKIKIGADTIPSTQKNLTPENAKVVFDKELEEYNKINAQINEITTSTPDRENKLKVLKERRQMVAGAMMANLDYLNQFPAYSILVKDHADLTPEAPTLDAKETGANLRVEYSLRIGADASSQLTPGQAQAKSIEELRQIFSEQWDQAKKVYDVFGQNYSDPARINAPLKMFTDAMTPYLKDGILPPETLAKLQENFLSSDGINMETALMISKDTAMPFFDSLIGLQSGNFDREQFNQEIQDYYTNGVPYRISDTKFTAEQIDLIIQAMYPSYATAVSMYQQQMDLFAKYSDEIRIAALANYMSNGDSDRYEIIYNYLVEHKDAKMMDWLNANISTEMKMGYINNYLKTNDIFRKAYGSSISINPNTGHVEYTSVLRQKIGDNQYRTLGYISFDPINNSFDAEVPFELGNKNITLFSDPRTGDVWAELGNANSSPLIGEGKIGLMTVTISKDGKIGGQFRLFNRLFAYNPNSGAFEMPVRLSNRAQITIDTKGNISGSIKIFGDVNSSGQGSLFFDRNGNMGVTLDLKTATSEYGRISTASVMYSKDGGITGTVDVGKVIGGSSSSSLYLSFDKNGVSGVNIPFGSWAGKPFGIGISNSGSLSLGGFVPIAGIPVPVGIAQDSSGGFRLAWPGGSLKIIGGDDRPQNPPELKVDDKTGFYDASCVYYRHSFKKLFQAVRVYQVPCETIDKTEQIERGDMIIRVYSELLGRKPSIGEFLNWYFYSGHELYAYPDHNQKEYRMKATEAALRRVIKFGPYKNMSAQFKFPNKEEYEWIKSGKDPLQYPKRPKETLTKNPFSDGSLNDQGEKDSNTTLNDLIKTIFEDKQKDDGKIIDQTSVIQDVSSEITAVDDTASLDNQTSNVSTADNQKEETETMDNSNTVTTKPVIPIESKLEDTGKKLSEIPVTNKLSETRVETVKKVTNEINKIALNLDEELLANKMVEVAKQQVESEKQTIDLYNKLDSQSNFSSFMIGANAGIVDKINKAQIDNNIRSKTLGQVSGKISDNKVAEDVYTQKRLLELSNQDLQKEVDKKVEKFSLFGWVIKLYKNIFN